MIQETIVYQQEMKIRSVFEKREKQEILIRADSSLPYGSVAAAMASVKNAGINKIGLVTDATGIS